MLARPDPRMTARRHGGADMKIPASPKRRRDGGDLFVRFFEGLTWEVFTAYESAFSDTVVEKVEQLLPRCSRGGVQGGPRRKELPYQMPAPSRITPP